MRVLIYLFIENSRTNSRVSVMIDPKLHYQPVKAVTYMFQMAIKNNFTKSLLIGFSLLLVSHISFGQLTGIGVETIVNSTTVNSQQQPETAMDTSGNYVVVWESFGSDGDDYGIYGQRYTSGGAASGAEFLVNTSTAGGQRMPDVAMGDDGNFIVVWMADSTDSDRWAVYCRAYDKNGTALSSPSRMNNSSTGNQMYPQVACDYAGNFVSTWVNDNGDGDSFAIDAVRRNANGVALVGNFQVNTTTAGSQAMPSIAMDSIGNFVIAWQSENQDGSGQGIYFKRYNNSGVVQGTETIANTTTAGNQQEPSVAMGSDGNFLITWSSFGQDTITSNYGIYGATFSSAGVAISGEIAINTRTTGTQDNADASVMEGNKFVVAWTSFDQDGDKAGIYAQMLLGDGSFYDSETKINTRTFDFQQIPAVAGNRLEKDVVVVWQDGLRSSTATHDGSDYGIYTRLHDVTDIVDPLAVCQNITVYLDGTGNVSIAATDVDGGSTDNVAVTSLAISSSAFTCANIGPNNVTLTVEDAAANSDNCVAVVTVADTTSPMVVCQNITVYLDGTGNATITTADVDNGSTDNCGTPTLGIDVSSFTCANIGTNNVTLTATDAASNTKSCVAIVTVADTISPTVVCQNLTVYLDGTGNATITAADVDNGSTDNCGTPTLGIDVSSFTCANIGANNVTLTGTDGASNTKNCIAVVTVVDTTSPMVVCQNLTVYLDGTGNVTITTADVDNGSTDNCGTPTLGIDVSSFTCANIGANNVTLTATDGASNTSNCVAVVTVADTISPTVVCQNITVYLDGTGNATIVPADVDNGIADNCGTPTLGIDVSSFTCANIGANNVTLTATDGGSNTKNCIAVVTVADTTSPMVVCQNITVYLDGTGNATIAAADVDNGSTDNCGTPTLGIDVSSFTCANIGINNVTLTATDGASNTSNCVAVVTVSDTTSPTVVCQNLTVYLDGTGNATITTADVDNGSTDNCGTPTLGIDVSSFTCANIGINNVTLTATDGKGNTSNCVAVVTVADTTSPMVVCQNLTVYLDGTGNATITTADVDNGSTDNCGTPTLGIDVSSFTCANIGINNVTLTATDGKGNTSNCVAVVTVVDTTSPMVVCQNLTVYLDGTGNATITTADVDNGSTDNCGTPTLGIDVSSFTCANIGINNVTLTATDGASNTSNCVAVVTVVDTTSPMVVCQNLTVYLDGTGNATITTADVDNGSTDNCGTPTLGIDVSSFTCANIGTNNVTLTATDGASNTSNCVAVVTVVDTTSPMVVCQNLTVYLDGTGNATITTADVDNGSTDNCGTPTLGIDVSSFTCANIGTNNVTLTGTDGASNTSNCVAVVTVSDTTSPTVVCQNLTVYLDGTGNATITTVDVDNGSTDNCGTPTLGIDVSSFTCANIGTNNVTLTGTDGASNTSNCVAVVTVVDTTSPMVVCQNLTVYLDGTGNATIITADVDNGSTDNCGTPTLGIDVSSFTCANIGTNNVTLTGTDGASNTSNCVAVVTVVDTTSPMVVCQNITVYLDGTGNATITTADVDNGSVDNCGTPTLGIDVSSFTCANIGTNNVTLTGTDGASNTSNCVAVVTVVDTTSPMVVCQNLTVYLDGTGNATITTADVDNGSTDNCGTPTLGIDVSSFTCANIGGQQCYLNRD